MRSHQKSPQTRLLQPLLWSVTLWAVAGCATKMHESRAPQPEITPEKVSEIPKEYSLKEDRSELESLRSEIPEPVRQKNDELALILGMMKEYSTPPDKIRRKFDAFMRKKRNKFNRDLRREREDFNYQERTKRDKFLEALKKRRSDFYDTKPDKRERTRFKKDYDRDRDQFFADAREKRKDREADFRQRRRDFQSYIHEKRRDFSDELRAYTKGYYDFQKAKKLKKRMKKKADKLSRKKAREERSGSFFVNNKAMGQLKEFEVIPLKPATTLQPEDSE